MGLLAALPLLSVSSPAQAFWPFEDALDYSVQLDGAEDDLAAWLREVSLLENDPDPAPESAIELESLAGADVIRVRDALKAKGYYDAQVTMRIIPPGKDNDGYIVRFRLRPGTLYKLTEARVEWQGDYHYPLENLPELAPAAGEVAQAETIQAGADRITKQLSSQFCLMNLNVESAVELDRGEYQAEPVYQITAGPPALIGDVEVSGQKRARVDLITRQSKLKPGSCFQQEKIDAARRNLLGSQLYAQADISPTQEAPNADGRVPVSIAVTERKARTIRLGASYNTDDGPGTTARWEHRNLNGNALKTTVDLTLMQRLQGVDTKVYQPDFLDREKQTLALNGAVQQELTDAYDAQSITLGANIERQLITYLSAGVGTGYRLSDVTRTNDQDTFGLVFFPAFVQWDNRNDAMNATEGFYARASLAPYIDTLGIGTQFLRGQLTTQGYLTAETWPLKPTLALRGVVGVIEGTSPNNVPADIRFYAGGGGSVRGYQFQSIGPQDSANDPIGGNSWVEFSTELRLRFTEEVGMVMFVDGGSVQPDTWKGMGKEFQFGGGMGLRYYTPVGPLRLDVGVPLNRRDNVDDAYQLYVSLGQAF